MMQVKWEYSHKDRQNQEKLYALFKERAEELTVTVQRVSSRELSMHAILEQIKTWDVKKVACSPLTLVDSHLLGIESKELGIQVIHELDRNAIAHADMGISEFHLGIADSGTLFQDASGLHCRLVSMLPPQHLALIGTSSLVPDYSQALEIIYNNYGEKMPPYLSFVTGPSKTADIERVLTIGVHGPGRLSIIFCDQEWQK